MNARSIFLPGLAVVLALLLGGCEQVEVVSIEPIISESEAIFDPDLVGLWNSEEAKALVVLFRETRHGKAYTLWAWEKCDPSEVRLGRLGEHLAMEISCPDHIDAGLSLPHHRLLVVAKMGPDEFHTWKLDPDVLLAALQAGEVRLAYCVTDDQVILYDSAASVRAQLTTYLDRPGVLAEPWIWVRARPGFEEQLTRPGQLERDDLPCFEASPWPEADALFRRDPRWAGGAIASSVELGDGEVLWLFNNVRLSAFEGGEAGAVTNAVALQSGTDPSTATIEFHLGAGPDGAPDAVISGAANERFYFQEGVRMGDSLLLLMHRYGEPSQPSWALMMVDNPGDEPASWQISLLDIPVEAMEAVGMPATVLALSQHIYLLGSVETPFEKHWVHVLRWPVQSVLSRDLARPEWMTDDAEALWVPGMPPANRRPLFETDTAEFTVIVDPDSGWFFVVQLGNGQDIELRASPFALWGWSEPRLLYRPPDTDGFGHSAQAHPMLTGADLVLTYHSSLGPRFLRLARCDSGVEP
jgi:hypothetical protein